MVRRPRRHSRKVPVSRASASADKEGLMTAKLLIVVAGLVLATSVQAVCYRDGRPYPTGAVVDGWECQADGTWKKAPPRRSAFLPSEVMPRPSQLEAKRREIGEDW
jgi:hypothetical protein